MQINGDPYQQKYLCTGHRKSTQTGVMHVCSQTCLPCDSVSTTLACFLFVVCFLFVCFVVFVLCVSYDEVRKPRSMQHIDFEVMSSTAEMSVLKCYHVTIIACSSAEVVFFNHPSRYFQLGLHFSVFCLFFCYSVFYHSQSDDNFTALPVILSWKYYSSLRKIILKILK